MRLIALALVATVVAQPVFAGGYLNGDIDALRLHSMTATIAEVLGFLLFIASIAHWVAVRSRGWIIAASLGLALLIYGQAALGYVRQLQLHVPLGVALTVLTLWFAAWLFGDRARVPIRPQQSGRSKG